MGVKHHVWTAEEDALLREWFARGDLFTVMGKRIGCSESAVRYRANKLGLPRRMEFWSKQELEQLRELRQAKTSWEETAAQLGRSVIACQEHMRVRRQPKQEPPAWQSMADLWDRVNVCLRGA